MTIASIVVLAAAAFAAIAIIVTALLPTPKPARRVRVTGSVRIRR